MTAVQEEPQDSKKGKTGPRRAAPASRRRFLTAVSAHRGLWWASVFAGLVVGSFPFLVTGAEKNSTRTSSPSPATNWLYRPEASMVLRVEQVGLRPECRTDAAELVQAVLNELLRAGYTVHLAREFMESEVAYYRANATNENARATAEAVAGCLDAALKAGALDWKCLRAAHVAAPDSAAITRNLPWLTLLPDPSQVGLADAAPSLTTLELKVRWKTRPVQGTSISTVNIRGVVQPALTKSYSGTAHLSNLDVTMVLREKGATLFERHYAEEPWKQSYVGPWDTPFYVTNQKILVDLRAGLKPPPPPAPEGKKKKKGK